MMKLIAGTIEQGSLWRSRNGTIYQIWEIRKEALPSNPDNVAIMGHRISNHVAMGDPSNFCLDLENFLNMKLTCLDKPNAMPPELKELIDSAIAEAASISTVHPDVIKMTVRKMLNSIVSDAQKGKVKLEAAQCNIRPKAEHDVAGESKPDKRKTGLYDKFRVERTDGRSAPGEKHHGCEYFCLDMQHDKHAMAALTAYAMSCEDEYPELAKDLKTTVKQMSLEAAFACDFPPNIVMQKVYKDDKIILANDNEQPDPNDEWAKTNIDAVFMDGNEWCATAKGFINLQESPAGFGDTITEAINDLRGTLADNAANGVDHKGSPDTDIIFECKDEPKYESRFIEQCKMLRKKILKGITHIDHLLPRVKGKTYKHPNKQSDNKEMIANLVLAKRHLEDARGRCGMAIKAWDGGESAYKD